MPNKLSVLFFAAHPTTGRAVVQPLLERIETFAPPTSHVRAIGKGRRRMDLSDQSVILANQCHNV